MLLGKGKDAICDLIDANATSNLCGTTIASVSAQVVKCHAGLRDSRIATPKLMKLHIEQDADPRPSGGETTRLTRPEARK